MSLGKEMVAKVQRWRPASSGDSWVDDDGTTTGSSASPDAADLAATLPPLGTQTRPNGAVYHPRAVARGFEDVALLRDARAHQEHVLFYGPPGTGKTALCEAAFAAEATAEHDGMESIVGTADTTEADFVGTFVQNPRSGAFEWRPGPLHRSVLHDVPLLVDEIVLIDPGC